MNRSMTAAVYGPGARTAESVAKSKDRVAAMRDAAHARRMQERSANVETLKAIASTYSLRELFAARNQAKA